MSTFVFLEIHDSLVVELLTDLRNIFYGKPSLSPIHVTVRGPYKSTPSEKAIEKLWSSIEGEGVLLNGIGNFEFGKKRFVYIHTKSKAIRKIWWKGDYPIFKYGFNPHITLYEGPTEIAKVIEAFLKKERLEFYCHNLSLRLYTSGQPDLFGDTNREVLVEHSIKSATYPLTHPYRWKEGIQDRAKELMQNINHA